MRVAVTGAGGRLGRAVVTALEEAPFTGPFGPIAWTRAIFDLDAPDGVGALLDRDRPEVVVHCAAWTDVDGCAREPELAMRRNGAATGALARAAAERGMDLIVVSTNEVFDGRRTDGAGYGPTDPTGPINPYGVSKLAGEAAAREAYSASSGGALGIGRTAWLYGPPGNDFPTKILAAADRLAGGAPLPVVADEVGSPTYAPDLAAAMLSLLQVAEPGTYHLANAGRASRADWARAVLQGCRRAVGVEPIRQVDFARPSHAPAWAVLDASAAADLGVGLRGWEAALADYLVELCPA